MVLVIGLLISLQQKAFNQNSALTSIILVKGHLRIGFSTAWLQTDLSYYGKPVRLEPGMILHWFPSLK